MSVLNIDSHFPETFSFIYVHVMPCDVNHIWFICRTTLEAIHSKQNMTYQCNCICTKTEKSPHEIANEIQNPDDINLIVSESATKLGNTGKSSDTYVHNSDQQDLHDEVKNEIEEEIVHDSETDVTPRWQILRTTPTDPNV